MANDSNEFEETPPVEETPPESHASETSEKENYYYDPLEDESLNASPAVDQTESLERFDNESPVLSELPPDDTEDADDFIEMKPEDYAPLGKHRSESEIEPSLEDPNNSWTTVIVDDEEGKPAAEIWVHTDETLKTEESRRREFAADENVNDLDQSQVSDEVAGWEEISPEDDVSEEPLQTLKKLRIPIVNDENNYEELADRAETGELKPTGRIFRGEEAAAEGRRILAAASEPESNVEPPPTPEAWFGNPGSPNMHPGITDRDGVQVQAHPFGTHPTVSPLPPNYGKNKTFASRLAAIAIVALIAGSVGAGITHGIIENTGSPVSERTVTVERATAADGATVEEARKSIFTVAVTADRAGGSGSGVAIDADHIVTNAHVVTLGGEIDPDAATVEVQDSQGREYPADIVGVDEVADVAVLRVDNAELVPMKWSDEDAAVGEPVLAIGAPLGLSDTVTDGIVSSVNRPVSLGGSADANGVVSEASTFINAIQTDAAINSGNSGGALINGKGELLGLNVAISSTGESTGSIGIGYAIPSSYAKRVANELIKNGVAGHGLLGVVAGTAMSSGGSFEDGAQIEELSGDSPAAKGGLAKGDIIISVNGKTVTNAGGLTAAIKELAPGSEVPIIVKRGAREREFQVTVAASE